MALKRKTNLKSETLLLIEGSLLLIISFVLYHYETIIEVKNDIKSEIDANIYQEKSNNISVNINVSYVDKDKDTNENNDTNSSSYTPNYIAFLRIDKINLYQGLLPKGNFYNYVDYHVQILDISDYPDVINGNFILAGHSGTSNVAYFKNLYKLKLGDIANVYYNGKVYTYSIVNIYLEDKDGSVTIYRDNDKTTLTLITCTQNDKLHQTVYILELIGVETY
ncbi:MAG: sortase [Bacilli bacterium]|nr:sortase [Bacilli bacterium]